MESKIKEVLMGIFSNLKNFFTWKKTWVRTQKHGILLLEKGMAFKIEFFDFTDKKFFVKSAQREAIVAWAKAAWFSCPFVRVGKNLLLFTDQTKEDSDSEKQVVPEVDVILRSGKSTLVELEKVSLKPGRCVLETSEGDIAVLVFECGSIYEEGTNLPIEIKAGYKWELEIATPAPGSINSWTGNKAKEFIVLGFRLITELDKLEPFTCGHGSKAIVQFSTGLLALIKFYDNEDSGISWCTGDWRDRKFAKIQTLSTISGGCSTYFLRIGEGIKMKGENAEIDLGMIISITKD